MNPYSFLDAVEPGEALAGFEFESASASVQQVTSGAAAVPLVNMRLIRVAGDDANPFLQNLLSNDVMKLAPGGVQWNSLNSPKGRMIASLLMWRDAQGILIALPAELHEAVRKRLSMYVLRSKVKVEDASGELALLGVAGAGAHAMLEQAGIALPATNMASAPAEAPRSLRITPELLIALVPAAEAATCWNSLLAAGAKPAGTSAWDLMQIRAGLPRVTQATSEEFVAQMLNFDRIGGVSFTKGCYPGQEIVARTQYLGKLKKRMYRLHVADAQAVTPGQDLFAPGFGDQSIGKVVLATNSPEGGWEALAVLQSSSAEAGDIRLATPDGVAAKVQPLPYSLT